MRSQHESIDDELAGRLWRYTEEPDNDLWEEIALHIPSAASEGGWVVWTQRASAVIIGGLAIIATLQKDIQSEEAKVQAIEQNAPIRNSVVELPDNSQSESIANASNMEVGKESNSVDNRTYEPVSHSGGDLAANDALPIAIHDSEKVEVMEFKMESPQSETTLSRQEYASDPLVDTFKIVSARDKPDTLIKKKAAKEVDVRKNQRHRRYTIYVTAMPTFGYQRVEPNPDDNIIIESIERIPTFSSKRLGLRAEIGVEFPVSKRLNVFGGVLYYQRKQTIGYTEKQLDSTMVTAGPNGEVIVEPKFSYLEKTYEYELRNLGVQLGFNYKLSNGNGPPFNSKNALKSKTIPIPKKKFLHLVGTGIEFHKALNETDAFNNAAGFSNPSAYVFVNAYYRLQYPSEGKLRAIFQPTFNYSFYINENLNAPFYVKPYALGLNFGCTYNF